MNLSKIVEIVGEEFRNYSHLKPGTTFKVEPGVSCRKMSLQFLARSFRTLIWEMIEFLEHDNEKQVIRIKTWDMGNTVTISNVEVSNTKDGGRERLLSEYLEAKYSDSLDMAMAIRIIKMHGGEATYLITGSREMTIYIRFKPP